MRTLNYLLKIITIMHPKFNLHWVVDVSKYGIQIFFFSLFFLPIVLKLILGAF